MIITSSSMLLALFLPAKGFNFYENKTSSFSAKVGKSALFAYLTDALLAIASKNCLCNTTLSID
jgi:hypothetical protein